MENISNSRRRSIPIKQMTLTDIECFDVKSGHNPTGFETMLRMNLMQVWFNLSDVTVKNSSVMYVFLYIDFNKQQV